MQGFAGVTSGLGECPLPDIHARTGYGHGMAPVRVRGCAGESEPLGTPGRSFGKPMPGAGETAHVRRLFVDRSRCALEVSPAPRRVQMSLMAGRRAVVASKSGGTLSRRMWGRRPGRPDGWHAVLRESAVSSGLPGAPPPLFAAGALPAGPARGSPGPTAPAPTLPPHVRPVRAGPVRARRVPVAPADPFSAPQGRPRALQPLQPLPHRARPVPAPSAPERADRAARAPSPAPSPPACAPGAAAPRPSVPTRSGAAARAPVGHLTTATPVPTDHGPRAAAAGRPTSPRNGRLVVITAKVLFAGPEGPIKHVPAACDDPAFDGYTHFQARRDPYRIGSPARGG